MTQEQVEKLARSGNFPDNSSGAKLIETHISWVLLTDLFAFKIKKPFRFNFLDFSTLDLRKHYCQEELRLNHRLTDIYLEVVPITFDGKQLGIGLPGEILDYAVKMKRVDGSRQMDLLLEKNLVTVKHIEEIAAQIVHFHQNTTVCWQPFDEEKMRMDFADLSSVLPVLTAEVDEEFKALIADWLELSDRVLEKYTWRFVQRVNEGFVRDGHGDLHSRNIFLLEKPIIFDCIEFGEHLRINDVLSELAFLAVDLDRFGRSDFKDLLIQKYREQLDCFPKSEDFVIFQYYLLYRAGVRFKIAGLSLREEREEPNIDLDLIKQEIKTWAELCKGYALVLKRMLLK